MCVCADDVRLVDFCVLWTESAACLFLAHSKSFLAAAAAAAASNFCLLVDLCVCVCVRVVAQCIGNPEAEEDSVCLSFRANLLVDFCVCACLTVCELP